MCVLPMRIRRTKTDKDRINLDKKTVTVIGAGLAGVEAAWALANRGFHVRLCEMKPESIRLPISTRVLRSLCAVIR